MSLRLAVTSALALALAVGVSTASAGPGGVQIQDAENDSEQLVEVLARGTEGTIDIVSASVPEEATRTATRPTALTRDLRVDLRPAYYPSHTKGMVYRVSGSAAGLCERADNRVTFETVMTENGPRSHLTTGCGSAPIPLQAEIGGNCWASPSTGRASWPAPGMMLAYAMGIPCRTLSWDRGSWSPRISLPAIAVTGTG